MKLKIFAMKSVCKIAAGCWLIILMVTGVFAEADPPPITLDAIVVTAEKEPASSFQTGDVDMAQTTTIHKIIRREAFEGRMESLSDVIQKESGIQIRQSGGLGSFSTVSLRGSSAEQVMVYLDGILINDASGGGVDLSNISLSDVESVEIFPGVSPLNFSKASVGGVVNIKTMRSGKSEKDITAKASIGYGSFDYRKLSAFANHKPGKWFYLISADYEASDNDFEVLNDNGTAYNTEDDRWEKRNNEQFDQQNILGKIGYDFTDTLHLSFSDQWFSKEQGLASWNNNPITETSLDTDRNAAALQLIADDLGPWHVNTVTKLDYMDKKEVYDDRQNHIGLNDQHLEYRTRRVGADFFLEWLTDYHTFNLSLAGHHETYAPDNLLHQKTPHDSSRDQLTAGMQDSVILFDEKVIVTPAVRYMHINDNLESAMSPSGIPLEGRTHNEDYVTPQLGFKYRWNDWMTLKSNIAQYVREPSFFELFGDRGFFKGNEDLEAEKGINTDAGFEIRKEFKDAPVSRFSFHGAGFMSSIDNLIARSYDTRGIGKSDNISKSEIKGFETGLSVEFLDYFRLIGNYTFQDTENKSEKSYFNGKKLPGRFETSWFIKLEIHYKGFKVFGELITEKDMYYETGNLLKAEDREQFNAGLSYLFKDFLFNVEVNNITDDTYEAFNGYPQPGISYFTSITYTY